MSDALNIGRVFGICNDLRKSDPAHKQSGASDVEIVSAHLACALAGLEAMGVESTGDSARKLLSILEAQIKRASRVLRERDAQPPTVLTGKVEA